MKKRLKEIEEEAGALREMQAKVEKEMTAVQGLNFALCSYLGLFSSAFVRLVFQDLAFQSLGVFFSIRCLFGIWHCFTRSIRI